MDIFSTVYHAKFDTPSLIAVGTFLHLGSRYCHHKPMNNTYEDSLLAFLHSAMVIVFFYRFQINVIVGTCYIVFIWTVGVAGYFIFNGLPFFFPENTYSLKNLRKTSAKLFFTQVRGNDYIIWLYWRINCFEKRQLYVHTHRQFLLCTLA